MHYIYPVAWGTGWHDNGQNNGIVFGARRKSASGLEIVPGSPNLLRIILGLFAKVRGMK
ncbi:TPA: hypothetical protein I8438_001158 [Serratia marcescens]|uniref:hypothetical protein n=1 Tax=Serratia marcescens TaxID=615 RepID=UPI000A6EB50B|nr:hypothetical protein [Serratia marcescens]MDP8872331.1 hypothetical protein [Serratia marcescens]HAT2272841.1 hypothetical protein [Serratia marcescens]HAT2331232.1 hypothetical protein [Serratia marcescens]HAT2353704.1 hypothetical protein [Serratia marcescens]HAT2391834.1 hypothetical protein [Serratia marcescens]